MRLVVCGINHQTAPLAIREQLAFNPSTASQALVDLLVSKAANEAVVLSTCNRTEIYGATNTKETLIDWMAKQPTLSNIDIRRFSYQYEDMDMVRHIMRVASGLDSMVLGEPQILGQMKTAYRLACEAGTVGLQFKQLFPQVFSVGKQIRSQTDIGKNPVSIAYVVVQLAKRLFPSIAKCRVLLIGAGETNQLVATHLYSQGVRQLCLANRSNARMLQFTESIPLKMITMSDIAEQLRTVDLVVTATASELPILGKGAIETAFAYRRHHPLLLIDLAVPRDVEPEVNQLEDVYLYNMDDVQQMIEKNWQHRETAAKQAEMMVESEAANYLRHLRLLKAGEAIHRFREQGQAISQQELKKAKLYFAKYQDVEATLAYLSRNLCNQLLHQPTIKLRQNAENGREDLLSLVSAWFDEN